MIFTQYLDHIELQVYHMVSKVVAIEENSAICSKKDIYGYFDAQTRTLTMCTNTLRGTFDVRGNINETLMHESVHVAQSCKTNFSFLGSFGIKPSLMPLSSARENDLRKVLAFDWRLNQIDREAFWMEDKPLKVKCVVKKYCRL